MGSQGSRLLSQYSRWLRYLLVGGALSASAGCADLQGIQAFGKMAPDPSVIQGLTKVYAQELDVREDLKVLRDNPPNPDVAAVDKTRAAESVTILKLDGLLRDYMQALVALSGSDIVQSSSSVKDVTTGLTGLRQSMPSLGITSGQVTLIGQLAQTIADIAEAGYRNFELVKTIKESDAPFHELLTVQSLIVTRAIRPSIGEIQRSLDQNGDRAVGVMNEELKTWIAIPVCKTPPNKAEAAKPYECREWSSGIQGESDARAAKYLLTKSLEADRATLATELATADAYTKSLDAIGKAYSKLVLSGKKVLTKQTLQEIQPLATEVRQDYQDARATAAAPAKH